MSDQPSIVFPPFNHEGIYLHLNNHREIDVERTTLPSPVSTPRSGPEESIAVGWWDAGIQVLRFEFDVIVSLIRCFCMKKGVSLVKLHTGWVNGGSVTVLFEILVQANVKERESIVQLICVIEKKDEKIHQLLCQIALMNELLLATHHGVPIASNATSA